jgi:hypothetical protein
MLKVYQVLKKFDSKKDYGFDIRPQYAKCLAVMKKGEKIDSKAFAKEHKKDLRLFLDLLCKYKITSK